jgi:hypothetical protein
MTGTDAAVGLLVVAQRIAQRREPSHVRATKIRRDQVRGARRTANSEPTINTMIPRVIHTEG